MKQSPTDSPGTVEEKIERIAGIVEVDDVVVVGDVVVVDDVVVVVSILEIPPQAVIKSPHTVARIIFCTHVLTTFTLAKCEMRNAATNYFIFIVSMTQECPRP